MLNLATCGARCVVKVFAGLFDVSGHRSVGLQGSFFQSLFDFSGHGSVWFVWLSWAKLVSVIAFIALLYGFLGPNLKVMAFLGQNWFILSYFSSERGLSSGTGSSELASGTSTSELVCPRACLLLC
jgi:hypothetical protein